MKNLSVQQSAELLSQKNSIPLIDVRTPAEYGSVHAKGAVNHPMESLDFTKIPFSKDDDIHVICQSGGRSKKVCQNVW